MVVAAYPYVAEVAVGGLLLALAEAGIASTIVVLAPRLFAGTGVAGCGAGRGARRTIHESAAAFGAGHRSARFLSADHPRRPGRRGPARTDPAAAAPPEPDHPSLNLLSESRLRGRVRDSLARRGAGPVRRWFDRRRAAGKGIGNLVVRRQLSRAAAGAVSHRRIRRTQVPNRWGGSNAEDGDPLPDPNQLARDRDRTDDGPAEELFLVGRAW